MLPYFNVYSIQFINVKFASFHIKQVLEYWYDFMVITPDQLFIHEEALWNNTFIYQLKINLGKEFAYIE